jgi:preprotein translocase subunit SecA
VILSTLEKFFGLGPERFVKKVQPLVEQIKNLDAEYSSKTEAELISRIAELKVNLTNPNWSQKELQKALDDVLVEVFAITREASWRVLGMKHFPVQCIGGIILHQGNISEMRTGEGKTLVATLPAVLNALSGRGVHIITVNNYLARRDSEWMGRLYKFLGLSVGLIVPEVKSAIEKRKAYLSDITYATNNELGFDYLRDNMAESKEEQVRRGFNFAIIDEVDSVLIDEARTPLIISGMPESSKEEVYLTMNQLSKKLIKGKDKDDVKGDYYVDEKAKNVILTDNGIANAEAYLGVQDLWSIESNLAHHVLQALKAKELFKRDTDYVIQPNPDNKKPEIVIVDEFTGRLMQGRRWSDGLHQAIEAKESVPLQEESMTLASITFQNFFRLYPKLGGMTGTAVTESEEFKNIYNLNVVPIPTNRINSRKDLNDQVYKNEKQKFYAILQEIISVHKVGRPVLVGTTSIEKSELLSDMLSKPQASVELMIWRSERLKRVLAEQNPKPEELIKNISRLLDKPFNITHLAAKEVFEKYTKSENTSSNLVKTIETVLSELPNPSDNDLTCFIGTFLDSCLIVEEIKKGIKHSVLNAKQHAREAEIIAQAGRLGGITIATNMAGRGTDILLGGNAEFIAEDKIRPLQLEIGSLEYQAALNEALEQIRPDMEANNKKIIELGGLHVIGTERHESRRIDNQLRGRAGRQGDPGTTRFFLGLDDSLMRIFGGDRLTGAMDMLKAEEDLALEAGLVNRGIENAQKRVEAHNYEIRKKLLEYDNVQDTQRRVIYKERQRILENFSLKEVFGEMLKERIDSLIFTYLDPNKPPETWFEKNMIEEVLNEDEQDKNEEDSIKEAPSSMDLLLSAIEAEIPDFNEKVSLEKITEMSFVELQEYLTELILEIYAEKENELGESFEEIQRQIFLHSIDQHWVQHLQSLDSLKEGIHLRGYGNKQPIIEYKTEALTLFDNLISAIRRQSLIWLFHTQAVSDNNKKKKILV